MAMANPALTTDAFAGTWAATNAPANVMTIPGTTIKAFGLLAIVMLCGGWAYVQAGAGTLSGTLLVVALLGGTVVGWVTIFKKTWAPVTAPLYAALEGVFLGAVSQFIEQKYKLPGLAFQAVGLTCAVTFVMLFLYATRTIRVTGRLAGGIVAATGAVCLIYVAQMILSMFHITIPGIFGSGTIGIAFSLFVVGLAAFNLLLDFDVIEQGAAYGAPKYMEWYGAFGLIVTLVWLYLEILRLLSKLNRRDS